MGQVRILKFASAYSLIIFLFQLAIFGTFNVYLIKVMIVALLLCLVAWLLGDKTS
ncbi:hypothetical protein [Candidatus Clostridium stratigraminis]|uniref:Uncharacterized protein n=1 Tax=Candidatus Clostridium stratigraminis TaxID=3381661 RepID=A0ABW8T7I5_9CLOT